MPRDAIEWGLSNQELFSAVLPGPFIAGIQKDPGTATFGPGAYPGADPGIPKNI